MSDKIRVLRISREGSGSYLECDLGAAIHELEMTFSEDAVGDGVTFTVQEMTREEYDALPEFTGW